MAGPSYHAALKGHGAMVGREVLLEHRPDLAAVWEAADRAFKVKVTRSFAERMDLSDPLDPLARQVLPSAEELDSGREGLDDPVGEKQRSPVPWVVAKHADRALLLLTKRCHLHCRYCFRRTHDPGEGLDPTDAELERALDWLAGSGVREVILSGGDPLAVSRRRLAEVLDRLEDVPVVRIHTRAPITHPKVVDAGLVALLKEHAPVWVFVHANHVRELSPEVDQALARLVDGGIPVLNQAVLLAGVNDRVEDLVDLCEALVARRVYPYYLHHPDDVPGAGGFWVEPERGLALHRELERRVSGLALPRYVLDPPDGSGKVPVERVLAE